MTTTYTNPILRKSTSSSVSESDPTDLKFAFVVDNETKILHAHISVLAQNSLVFRDMVFGSLPETEMTINIDDASYGEFEEFLQFFYQKEVKLTMQNIEGVVRLADKYDVIECTDICATFLESHMTLANLFFVYQLAVSVNIPKLKTLCEDKIQHSTLEIFHSSAFLDYTKEMLDIILQRDALACTETQIIDACVAWAKNSCRKNELDDTKAQNLRQQLGDSLYSIRFRAMTGEEIVQVMTNQLYAGMFSHKELVEVLCLRNVKDFKCESFCLQSRDILSYELNKNPELICTGGECYYEVIQKESEVFFKSTDPALLKTINFFKIPELSHLTFTITITENNVPEVLFHGSITYDSFTANPFGPKLSLSKALMIKPKTVYRISISTDGINGNMPRASIGTLDTSDLMENIPLFFVHDPSKEPPKRGGVSTSIVKAFHFKTIKS